MEGAPLVERSAVPEIVHGVSVEVQKQRGPAFVQTNKNRNLQMSAPENNPVNVLLRYFLSKLIQEIPPLP